MPDDPANNFLPDAVTTSSAAAIAFPFLAFSRQGLSRYGMEVVWGAALLAAIVFVRHRSNIGRMLSGTEPKFGQKTPSGAAR